MKKVRETKTNEIKKVSVKQAKAQCKAMELAGIVESAETAFNLMCSKGLVSDGRGCYTEAQEQFIEWFNVASSAKIAELQKAGVNGVKDGKLVNSKGALLNTTYIFKSK